MKHIRLMVFGVLLGTFLQAQVGITYNFQVNTTKGLDGRSWKTVFGKDVPYSSVLEATTAVVIQRRVRGLVALIDDGTGLKTYWYKDSILNSNLVLQEGQISLSTIAAALGGTTSQYLRGNGTLATFPTVPAQLNATGTGVSGTYPNLVFNGGSPPNIASDIFNGSTAAQFKGNVIYNVISDFTGQNVNYQQVTKFVDGTNMTDANVDSIYIRKKSGLYYRMANQFITVKDFGAVGDGVTDDYAALQKAINVMSSWGKNVNVPSGSYYYSHTLYLPQTNLLVGPFKPSAYGFFTTRVIGENNGTTEFHLTDTTSEAPCFLASGGSGGFLSGGGIENLIVTGTYGKSIGLEVQGRTGLDAVHCTFYGQKYGVMWINSVGSPFTEQSVMRDCNFPIAGCQTVGVYRYNGGDRSFNGSGFVGGTCTLGATDSVVIDIQGPGRPYNSPLDRFKIFFTGSTGNKVIVRNPSGSDVQFNGTLQGESQVTGSATVSGASGQTTHFVGGISWEGLYTPGRLLQSLDYIDAGGQPASDVTLPYTISGVFTGGNLPASALASLTFIRNGATTAYEVLITISGSNYFYKAKFTVSLAIYYPYMYLGQYPFGHIDLVKTIEYYDPNHLGKPVMRLGPDHQFYFYNINYPDGTTFQENIQPFATSLMNSNQIFN